MVESGLSVDPEDLGRQFLRDATDQNNFESDLHDREEADVAAAARVPEPRPQHRRTSERTAPDEQASEVDLHSSSIKEASLFDQPTEQGTRSPRIEADESETEEEPKGARETAEALALARLKRLTRPQRHQPPVAPRSRTRR